MRYDTNYAESQFEDSALDLDLMAGDTPALVTSDELITNAAAWPQYRVLQRNASTGAWELWAPGLPVAGVVAYDIPIGTAKRSAIMLAGMFNIDVLVWPASTTEAQAQAGCTGMIRARKFLYSDKRLGTEQLGVPAGPSTLIVEPGSGALANSVENVAMTSVQLAALNATGAVAYSLYSGALPAGTTLSAAGLYAGTPTTVGAYTFAVKAVDAADGKVSVTHYTHSIVAA